MLLLKHHEELHLLHISAGSQGKSPKTESLGFGVVLRTYDMCYKHRIGPGMRRKIRRIAAARLASRHHRVAADPACLPFRWSAERARVCVVVVLEKKDVMDGWMAKCVVAFSFVLIPDQQGAFICLALQ